MGHRVLGSYIPDTEANFNEFKKRMAAESEAANANTIDEHGAHDNADAQPQSTDGADDPTAKEPFDDNDDDDADGLDAPPLAGNSSVRVDTMMRDEDNVVEDENMAEPQKETVHSDDVDTAKKFQEALQVADDETESHLAMPRTQRRISTLTRARTH